MADSGKFFAKIVLHSGTVLIDMCLPSNVGFFLKLSCILSKSEMKE